METILVKIENKILMINTPNGARLDVTDEIAQNMGGYPVDGVGDDAATNGDVFGDPRFSYQITDEGAIVWHSAKATEDL